MTKITMKVSLSMSETFEDFLFFKKSMGLSEKTLRTYKEHLSSIGKHLSLDNERQNTFNLFEQTPQNVHPNFAVSEKVQKDF